MNRPPAYQCYASDLLASEWYFTMSAEARGVYHSICLGCWVNDTVPRDPSTLAALVRLPESAVAAVLTRLLELRQIVTWPLDASRLHMPALTEQMAVLMERRARNVVAGRKGGQTTQGRVNRAPSNRSSSRSSALSRDETKRSEEQRTEVYRETASIAGQEEHSAWVQEYDDAEPFEGTR
jgi:hypothetical protein